MTDRKQIIENVRKLKILPPKTEEDSRHNHNANHCAYVVRSGDRATGKDRQFLINHPQVFIEDIDYTLVKVNSLKYEVYHRNNPISRFYQQSRACEYILMLLQLI